MGGLLACLIDSPVMAPEALALGYYPPPGPNPDGLPGRWAPSSPAWETQSPGWCLGLS